MVGQQRSRRQRESVDYSTVMFCTGQSKKSAQCFAINLSLDVMFLMCFNVLEYICLCMSLWRKVSVSLDSACGW